VAAVALAMSLTALGIAQADDPNALADPPALFAADWDTASLAVTIYNPAADPNGKGPARKDVVTVTGTVYPPDVNDLVAFSATHAAALQAFDQDGREVLFDPDAVVLQPGRRWWLDDRPVAYAVELYLDPNQTVPTSLSQLDFTVQALYAQPFTTVVLPLEVSVEPIALLGNFQVRITDVNVVGAICSVAVEATMTDISGTADRPFDPEEGYWDEHVSPRGHVFIVSDPDVIFRAAIVDSDGNHVRRGGSESHSTRSSGGVVVATTGFVIHDCLSTEGLYLRYRIAMYPYEVPILLTLQDVAIPGLR
jgi:hypothetical protein